MSKIEINNIYKIFGNKPDSIMPMVQDGATKDEVLEETGHTVGLDNVSLNIEEGETSANFKYPDFMKKFHKDVLSKHENIQVVLAGGANTRRPLEFTDIGALIGGRELNIGHKVTDVTVTGDGA